MMFRKMLWLSVAVATALTVSAAASNFDETADRLHEMDLFLGTQQGYELDRAPSRAEAATMLVRMLGKGEEAEKTAYTAPFTDVPTWAKPYVGWLYSKGLTNGTGTKTYSPNNGCTAQMYATFLMRALGYSDTNGDFSYTNALSFAEQKGVINAANYDKDSFLRDHVVAMSYTALATQPKSGEANLLTKLTRQGAVDGEKAAKTLATFNAWTKYAQAVPANASSASAKETLTATQGNTVRLSAARTSIYSFEDNGWNTDETITVNAAGTDLYNTQQTLQKVNAPLCTTVVPICVIQTIDAQQITYNKAGMIWLMQRISADFLDGAIKNIEPTAVWLTKLESDGTTTTGTLTGSLDGADTTIVVNAADSYSE